MKFKADEIASILRKEIETFGSKLDVAETGTVLEVGDGIARIYGLSNAMSYEMVEFDDEKKSRGLCLNLEENSVGAVILGDCLGIKEGMAVRALGTLLEVPVGEALIGRVVNGIGQPIDGQGPIKAAKTRPVESPAAGVADRQPVKVPLQTGIKAIDAMTPVGRGQRELIIGDRKVGKTTVAVDAILNQKGQVDQHGKPVICVYVAVGLKESTVAQTIEVFEKNGAMDYTIVVVAGSSDPAPLQYLAPYAGTAMAEYFMWEKGGDTLVVYDDLSKQAAAYRQLSLLLRRPPGREAYPGDIFYCHSRLLERSARLSAEKGGGSLTALPIIETLDGDVSAYIPTNVISITDGQIYLTPELFFAGVRPAINVGISVSRVGGNAQNGAMKKIAGSLKLDLSAFRDLEAFAQLGTELDKGTQGLLDRGYRMVEVLKQPQYKPIHVADQVAVIYAGAKGFLDTVPVKQVRQWEADFIKFFRDEEPEARNALVKEAKLTDDVEGKLKAALAKFSDRWRTTLQKK